MTRITRTLVLWAACIAINGHAADLYLQNKDVTKSSFYTGSTGAASASAVTAKEWLAANAASAAELGVRDYGFIIEDAELAALTYEITNRLLEQWPGTVPPFAIFIRGDSSPLQYGAATTYTREIFINYGVFMHAESEDELAAVIGHELAHVLLEHGKALAFRKSMDQSLDLVSKGRDLYATANALSVDDQTREIRVDPAVERDLKKSASQRVVADKLYGSIHASLFSRGNEYDADMLAVDLLVAAGYSPMGLKISLERMAHSYDLSQQFAGYFEGSSQTLLEQALVVARESISETETPDFELEQYIDNAKDDFKASALEFGKASLLEFTSRSHPVPDKRVDKITNYLYSAYPRSIRRRQPDADSVAKFRSGHINDIIERYAAANHVVEAISFDDLDTAAKFAVEATSGPTSNDPYPRYAAFLATRKQGDRTAAVANIESIDPDRLMPVFATIDMTDYLVEAGDAETANRIMTEYEGYFGPIDEYYPPKIRLSAVAEDQAGVERLALECFDAVPVNSSIDLRCAALSGMARPVADKNAEANKATEKLRNLFMGGK